MSKINILKENESNMNTDLAQLCIQRQKLKEELRQLSTQINNLKRSIYRKNNKKYHKENAYENEECYLLFKKHYRDLSCEELKKYNALRQKKSREQKNGNIYSLAETYEKFYKNKWQI